MSENMKDNTPTESIIKHIVDKVKIFAHTNYKEEWINSSTDLYSNLRLSENEIIALLIDLEKDYNVDMDSIPIKSKPSLKIGYIASVLEHSNDIVEERYEKKLLTYALDNVVSYNKWYRNDKITRILDIDWEGDYHKGNEYDSISLPYYARYSYGGLIQRRVLNANGEYCFTLKTLTEKLISELPLWRKRRSWYGISPDDKHVSFVTFNYIGNRLALPMNKEVISEKGTELIIFESAVNYNTVNYYLEAIKEFSPKWIIGNCSILYNLCLCILEMKYNMQEIKYVEIEANNIPSEEMLETIRKAFRGAKVAVSVTNPHKGPYLITCPEGHLHPIGNSTLIYSKSVLSSQNDNNGYCNLFLSSFVNISAPVINVDSYVRGIIIQGNDCIYCQENNQTVKLAPTCNFNGFIDKNNWYISAELIKMCVDLVNSEYNNPFSALQILQTKQNSVKLFLKKMDKFKNWEDVLTDSLLSYLNTWASNTIEFELIILDEMNPCEYTGVLSYFQNHSI